MTVDQLALVLIVSGIVLLTGGLTAIALAVVGRPAPPLAPVAALGPVIDVRETHDVIDLREIDHVWSAAIPSSSARRDE